jgi:hypothetical protein
MKEVIWPLRANFVGANSAVPHLAKWNVGDNYSTKNPDVNPLYRDLINLKGLNPQLIFTSGV